MKATFSLLPSHLLLPPAPASPSRFRPPHIISQLARSPILLASLPLSSTTLCSPRALNRGQHVLLARSRRFDRPRPLPRLSKQQTGRSPAPQVALVLSWLVSIPHCCLPRPWRLTSLPPPNPHLRS